MEKVYCEDTGRETVSAEYGKVKPAHIGQGRNPRSLMSILERKDRMKKIILGRTVEYYGIGEADRDEHEIRICRTEEEIEEYDKAVEKAEKEGCSNPRRAALADLDDVDDEMQYYDDKEFQGILKQVFPCKDYDNPPTWNKDQDWTDDEVRNYIAIIQCSPEETYDFE